MTTTQAILQAEQEKFLASYPKFDSKAVAALRAGDYSRLDKLDQVYLDYTGGGLYASSQLEDHMALLANNVYGNPHSGNPTSLAMTRLDEQARDYVMRYFNASPDDYIVIFTQNASGALRIVGESYPFSADSTYLLTFDNHNSVNGIREFAKDKGAKVVYTTVTPSELRLDEDALRNNLKSAKSGEHNLFAYPAQSNFSGVQHSLEWISKARKAGWDVLVDAAAFAPTNRLDLSRWQPDFLSLSFYKIFGYPTGVGALFVRKAVLPKLRRPWFAGGTIEVASVGADDHFLADGSAAFEDGTIDYLSLPAVEIGLKHIENLGIDAIHDRVTALTGWLLENMLALHHSNGNPLISIYGPHHTEMRGGTIACNFHQADGTVIDFRKIEDAANQFNISIRTGCFCNPGAGETALNISPEQMKSTFESEERMTFHQFVQAMTQYGEVDAAGAVRISVGLATNFADVYRFIKFGRSFLT